MLQHSFLHLPRIGAKSERRLWSRRILTWEDYEACLVPELPFSSDGREPTEILAQSKAALTARDAAFFARALPKSEHYRIALSFPQETAFLDIETTGLSAYYNQLTVVGISVGTNYYPWIFGDDTEDLANILTGAKCIVTFNGSIFDLPFLRRHLPTLALPEAHVDLRFLCHRLGLRGGQKAIEATLGRSRPSAIASVGGADAVELWSDYRLGDGSALSKLIRYNQADVQGMKLLFDEAVRRILDGDLGELLPPPYQFSQLKDPPPKALARPYRGPKYPLLHLTELAPNRLKNSGNEGHGRIDPLVAPCVVGIDPTGSEGKPSGFCVLSGSRAVTARISSDDDLVAAVEAAKPDLVSVDSPLSLPRGRLTPFDDDPTRATFGILRECERTLKRRGVNIYPSLIPSMQRMTARSIALARRLRELGVPVIESYPGAAQDIMGIVRKRKGLDRLTSGLVGFGVTGRFTQTLTSHDELDAITAAVVGRFFLDGRFEALGNDDEDYLIIPDLLAQQNSWSKQIVVGLSGPIAAGKTTLARHLESEGFRYVRYSQIIERELRAQGKPVDREHLQELGKVLNSSGQQRWLSQQLLQLVTTAPRVVVDGLRFPEDHAFWSERAGPSFHHVHVRSAFELRAERYGKLFPNEDFRAISVQPVERQTAGLAKMAHFIVENDGALDATIARLDQWMASFANASSLCEGTR